MIFRLSLFVIFLTAFHVHVFSQAISGTIRDAKTDEAVPGATIVLKGTTAGTTTDLNGKFSLDISQPLPFIIVISIVGYQKQELEVKSLDKPVVIKLKSSEVLLKNVEVVGSRISEKQKEAPLTVESMDMIAIKECPQTSFYEALGSLKGVDLTSASLGFTIVNTRGFNSTSPVRSLQIIDGVDNQAPGLNFSLGNFLGCSELDVLKVEMIAGASSAYFGPNAFNGVIGIYSRSPFVKPGLEVTVKVGERNLAETAIRWSQVFKNKKGIERFGYKMNAFYMQAKDWQAANDEATPQSLNTKGSPGGYDAVNRYGDEYSALSDFSSRYGIVNYPGLHVWYRTGYWEKDLVDYNTQNMKLGAAFHYKFNKGWETVLASNFGTGTTVYQGDNRYSLKDILFFQNRIEVRKQDKFFIRVYGTNENAGKSYDAFFTALKLQQSAKSDKDWARDYYVYWATRYTNRIRNFPGYPQSSQYPTYTEYVDAITPFLLENYFDSLVLYHGGARDYADNRVGNFSQSPFYAPGTSAFDSAFQAVSGTVYTEGGSKFYDKSALYHVQAEYKFTPRFSDITIGGNYRTYVPDSRGTIFQDTGNVTISNREFGFYGGLEKRAAGEKLKLNLTARLDKNENFDYLFSPAMSAVYSFSPQQIIRFSFSSAIRNPTLADQYLYYRVSPLVYLVGNVDGFDSLVTIESLILSMNNQNPDTLSFFNVNPIQPEAVKTVEWGYRATLLKNIYMDLVAYYSWYKNFIGYRIGATYYYESALNLTIPERIYRVATNSEDEVNTMGVSVGLNYYFKNFFALTGNYSYNRLDRKGSDDPLIPAFNTPEHKFNLGLTGRDIDTWIFKKIHLRNIGFGITYKWVEGFQFEGSPQFTGFVPTYDLVDAQVSYRIPKISSTLKLGSSNILNNKKYTVYGGPTIGRLAYFSLLVELNK